MPVDLYVGGAEHAVLHLLYSRFWHKVLFDRGHVHSPEPFMKLVNQGMILGEVEYTGYQDAEGRWLAHPAPETTRPVKLAEDEVVKKAMAGLPKSVQIPSDQTSDAYASLLLKLAEAGRDSG